MLLVLADVAYAIRRADGEIARLFSGKDKPWHWVFWGLQASPKPAKRGIGSPQSGSPDVINHGRQTRRRWIWEQKRLIHAILLIA
eukprot:4569057-Amphidinium_carterae.1